MKPIKCLMIFVAFLFVAQAGYSQIRPKKEKKELDVASKTVERDGGTNPNIKSDIPTKDNVKQEKIGSRAGAGKDNCYVEVVNTTDYTIHVYLDGYFAGTVGPRGSLNSVTGTGYTTCYGISAGGSSEWSTNGDCSYDYTFKFTY